MRETMNAGVALTDITPSPGIELAGYPHHPRHNQGVHDPLQASCLVLQHGRTRLAIFSLDLLMYSKSHVRVLRHKLTERTGIPPGQIMVCSSHTHSGPWASGRLDLEGLQKDLRPDPGYLNELEMRLCQLFEQASDTLFDARVGVGRGYCGKEQGVGGNRHDPRGITDPEVWVVGVQDLKGVWRGCLVKYALHPTFLHSDNVLVSADYVGYLRSALSQARPGMVMLFAQGTSGNQSPRFFRSGKTFAEAERVGRALSHEVNQTLDSLRLEDSLPLWAGSAEIEIPLRSLPSRKDAESQVIAAREHWESVKASSASGEEVWAAELRLLGAEDTLGYILLQQEGRKFALRDDELPVEIQVLGIGDSRIVGIQGELFVEFGLTIQYRSPFVRTFVIELANGCLPGYAATARAYAEGGYEAGTSLLAGESGDKIVDAAVGLLRASPR